MKLISLTLSSLALISGAAHGQIIFQDNFTTASGANNLGINDSIGTARQTSGTTSTYTMSGANVGANVSTNDDNKTNNGSTSGNSMGRIRNNEQNAGGTNGFLSLDTNFGSSLAGNQYTISFDLYYNQRATSTTDQWFGFGFGDSILPTGPNAADTDFGMLTRPTGPGGANDGVTRFYDDSAFSVSDDAGSTPDFTSNYVNFIISVTETGGGTGANVTVSAGAMTLVSDFAIDFDNSTNRYFSFSSHLGADVNGDTATEFADSFIDNVTITVVPEPSSFALIGGLLTLGFVAVKRRQ